MGKLLRQLTAICNLSERLSNEHATPCTLIRLVEGLQLDEHEKIPRLTVPDVHHHQANVDSFSQYSI